VRITYKMASDSKRQSIRERRRKKQRQQRLTVILVITAVALVLVGLAFLPKVIEALTPVGDIVVPEPILRSVVDFNTMGNPNAPVVMVEYSDFQCPFCKRYADETESLIIENHVETGEVYYIRRSFGNYISDNLKLGRTESIDSAEAAYCAGDQEKYWEYKDILFANWLGEDAGSYTEKRLMAMAEAINLDMDPFRSCFTDHKYRELAQQDRIDGTKEGITSTPGFLINGKYIAGAQPYPVFAQEIQAALAASGN